MKRMEVTRFANGWLLEVASKTIRIGSGDTKSATDAHFFVEKAELLGFIDAHLDGPDPGMVMMFLDGGGGGGGGSGGVAYGTGGGSTGAKIFPRDVPKRPLPRPAKRKGRK